MLKLTLILCIAIYACMIIFSDPAVAPIAPAPEATELQSEADPAVQTALQSIEGRTTLTTEDGRVLQVAAVITPAGAQDLRPDRTTSAAPEPARAEDGTSPPDAPPSTRPLVEVTGSTVNLRSGPSTDTAILDSLPRGTQAEILATLADGWAQIRVIETGTEGYMADRFLAAVN